MSRIAWLSVMMMGVSAVAGACGSPEVNGKDTGQYGDSDVGGAGGSGSSGSNGPGNIDVDVNVGGEQAQEKILTIKADGPTDLIVQMGEPVPLLGFSAFVGGLPTQVVWSVDRGDLASVTRGKSSTATLTPTAKSGGKVTVIAGYADQQAQVEVSIGIRGNQNGADLTKPGQAAQVPASAVDLKAKGGPGGVGGEGLGTPLTDGALLGALDSPSSAGDDVGLKFIYPYNRTVFPRGVLAPLLAWSWMADDAEAIKIELATSSGNFKWSGTFARPAILDVTGGKFVQHPIPQDVWELATNTALGKSDPLNVKLTVAGATSAYGPIEQSWIIADARLTGTIYYLSYGTNLAKNYGGAIGGDTQFGGATLGIRVGDTGPSLVVGRSDASGCRVCHSVAANGSRIISSGPATNSPYTLELSPTGASNETPISTVAEFPAITPDGSLALTQQGALLELPAATTPLSTTGLSEVSTYFGPPMFSPDGKKIAFNPVQSATLSNPTQKLVVMDFDKASLAFANPVSAVDLTGQPEAVRPGWPAFFPDSKSLVYHQQLGLGADQTKDLGDLRTRYGATAQIFWANIDGGSPPTALNQLNGIGPDGKSYLAPLDAPTNVTCGSYGAVQAGHESDENLNYEPTVNPVASGGYAWVVFTSRRRYAHVATIPPFCSDPRELDLITNVTPKKLWVAAVDLEAKPGEDASHPAFYLPGQELLAGNARGFWVLDPCRSNGSSCETGDQCCNGFCQASSETGELICGDEPPDYSCSMLQEKCESSTDCCDKTLSCIGGFCSAITPK